MGSPKTEKNRQVDEETPSGKRLPVTIPAPFAVGKFEVSRAQFHRFMKATGRKPGDSCWTYTKGNWKDVKGKNYLVAGFSQTDNHPAVCINWIEAQAYVKWLSSKTGSNYRLLSEAEWEYAARAGTRGPFSWSGKISTAKANYAGTRTYDGSAKGEYRRKTVPVKSFEPNAFGLYQMHGNVWEWVQDCWDKKLGGPLSKGKARTTGGCILHVLRGGSWNNNPHVLRAANRIWNQAGFRSSTFGFRLARTLTH